jgi:hypothetical protein
MLRAALDPHPRTTLRALVLPPGTNLIRRRSKANVFHCDGRGENEARRRDENQSHEAWPAECCTLSAPAHVDQATIIERSAAAGLRAAEAEVEFAKEAVVAAEARQRSVARHDRDRRYRGRGGRERAETAERGAARN